MIEQWVEVRFEKLIKLRKKFKIMSDFYEDVKLELAEAMKKQLQSIVDNVSIKDFAEHCCRFSSYKEEVDDDGIIEGDRVYYSGEIEHDRKN